MTSANTAAEATAGGVPAAPEANQAAADQASRNGQTEAPQQPVAQAAADTAPAPAAPAPAPPPAETPAAPSRYERAEALAENVASQVGAVASYITHGLLRFFARAREEIADMWAEAQDLRHGSKDKDKDKDKA
jgi:hypothetical protein